MFFFSLILFVVIDHGVLQVMSAVDVKHTKEHELTLEWDSSASNDMIADSTLALITSIDKSPASVKRTLFALILHFLYPSSCLPFISSIFSGSYSIF